MSEQQVQVQDYTPDEIQQSSSDENVQMMARQVEMWQQRAIALNIEVRRALKACEKAESEAAVLREYIRNMDSTPEVHTGDVVPGEVKEESKGDEDKTLRDLEIERLIAQAKDSEQ